MALVVAEDKNLCNQCNFCFEKSLDLEYYRRSYRFYTPENEQGFYLIVYMQPNLEMMLNEFVLTRHGYGYRRFLSLLDKEYIHHPIVRGISHENDKGPDKRQAQICKEYLVKFIERSEFKQAIVLGVEACSLFGVELHKVQKIRIGSKIVSVIGLKSPSSVYYQSNSMLKDQSHGDHYYLTYLTVLKDVFNETNNKRKTTSDQDTE